MPTPIQPIGPVVAPDAAATAVVLRPGAAIDAVVVKLLEANLVRIAIAGLMLDVASEVPLQAGQALRFVVTPSADGLRLVIAPPAAGASATVAAAAPLAPVAASPVLTATERQAVAAATTQAATRQGGLAPLFADLAAAPLAALAPAVRAAAAQVLATRLSGDGAVTGEALKAATDRSGLFLEQRLATGAPPLSGRSDMKAALTVLRHALAVAADAAGPAPALAPSSSIMPRPPVLAAPSLVPDGPDLAPASSGASASRALIPVAAAAGDPRPVPTATMLVLLREALAPSPQRALMPSPAAANAGGGGARTALPPPPYRGATPTAQPAALPSLAPDTAPAVAVHRLLADTEAALARQTLLQVASLPGPDAVAPRPDQSVARWLFEVPIALPQGTAVAQFEIFRDGGRPDEAEGDNGRRVWRARFSLDIEPAGPVHALVSLTGGATSVRMWAERPLTAARLRSDTSDLSRALREAALAPGDIVISDGAPPVPAAPAGHFWDRAS
jgi:hypothetical protein